MSDLWGRIVKLGLMGRHPIVASLTIILLVAAFSWQIGSQPAGFGPREALTIHQSSSLHALYNQPLNAPHNIFIYGVQKLGGHGLLVMRAVSAVWALVFIGCFYRVMRSWFGSFIAWLASLLLAFTPLVLLAGRSATADIMYLAPLVVIAVYFGLKHTQTRVRFFYICLVAVAALSLYTPGLIWPLLLASIAVRGTLKKLVQSVGLWPNLAALATGLIIVAPLTLSFVHAPDLLHSWALIPAKLPSVVVALKDIGWMFTGLFWQTGAPNDLQIDRLPLLNIGQLALAVFGVYAFWSKARDKSFGLITAVLLLVVLAGLNTDFNLLILATVPAMVLAAAGLRYLHMEWQGVFPRNPIPRSLALVLMVAIVALNILYGVRYSLIAWPHTLAVRQTYVLK